ncbi:cysteine proteinase [Hysterangium stoloniferum]|nr:cysteine proteinase [Hysterangium stoloniferum]
MSNTSSDHDLIGGPFAVVESDPDVFTSIIRGLGVQGLEIEEVYSIEPWAIDHLRPHVKGLVFCFPHQKDYHPQADFCDPTAESIWFANQLSDDACATHAILNIVLNVEDIQLGDTLQSFKIETSKFDSVMKGLAITNSSTFCQIHNSVARPSDLQASLSYIATETIKAKPKTPNKRRGKSRTKSENLDSYHFIGYIPLNGKVWELDGLKKGPLEVGEIGVAADHWIDVVRPVLRVKMARYGGTEEDSATDIRFNLLALVSDRYEGRSDDLELLKRQKLSLERRMGSGWEGKVSVDSTLALERLTTSIVASPSPQKPFSADFGARYMEAQKRILDMEESALPHAWNDIMKDGLRARLAVQEEIDKATRANTEQQKRTFDYGPFIRQYLLCLKDEGLLNPLLGLDDEGKKPPKVPKVDKGVK